ncbi:hypothetical protein LTR05_005066 [Lithohypha guttulata]|uniref:Non-structural maintenance of chromosomes element 4 n=1 Tax=Lithohypha guttulata TaxID=1690604 RepID=A0AAN7SZC2_9EURO|nr:hypothetical protein LTR05_005066 [Lithohypha guttulata]
MARLNERQSMLAPPAVALNSDVSRSPSHQPSPTPSEVFGSDKENAGSRATRSSLGKRKSTSAAMSTAQPTHDAGANKRRRTEDQSAGRSTQAARRKAIGDSVDSNFYDPDQDETSKSTTTQRYRQLQADVNDARTEYLQRDSRGIQDAIKKADDYIKDVRQTSTAAIDSGLLVNLGDLSYKKISTMTLGDSTTAIDVDDFLTKCISYMQSADANSSAQMPSTQRRRDRRCDDDDDGDGDNEDEEHTNLNWAHLGRTLCFPASNRPCLSSFLLGPLSLQKKVRAPTQRRVTQRANLDPSQAQRPIQLDEAALDRQESASLTALCGSIATLLASAQRKGERAVEQQAMQWQDEDYDASEEEVRQLMRKHKVRDNGGVPLFDFCINPKSFGQSVENFFYVSFLIKEGRVGLDFDSDEMPTLGMVDAKSLEERQESVRNQAIFTLDFDIWQELVQSCGITESIVPHRDREIWEDDDGVLRAGLAEGSRASSGHVDGAQPLENDDGNEDSDLYD